MIKTILRTLSFYSVAILSAAEQSAPEGRGAASIDSLRAGCPAQTDIDRGWKEQQEQLERRFAEKEAEGLLVPGAIITPPFESYAPYRTDLPTTVTAARPAKGNARRTTDAVSRD